MQDKFWLPIKDGVDIYVSKWTSEANEPKAIVQISHGMAEHIQRYEDFANYLLEQNIYVYGNDHRGHGQTGQKQGQLGYFAKNNGFKKVADDLYEVTKRIKTEYPTVPIILFGHSMGSFLSRKYIQNHSDTIHAVVLSGTGNTPLLTTQTGKLLASMLRPTEKSYFMNKLVFGSYNKQINNNTTGSDWLTRDEQAVQMYIDDPFSGFVPTGRFFYDLMDGLLQIQKKASNTSIRKDLPILLISGDADPVGDYGKGVWKAAEFYHSLGLESVSTMLFENARHELLNEINKDEVYDAINVWIHKQL